MFPINSDVILEIGPGRGDFLFWLAKNNPNKTIVAIEYKFMRYTKLIQRTRAKGLTNILIIKDYAQNILNHIPNRCVSETHIQFPDPWPKRKHGHNRLISDIFLDNLSKVAKDGSSIRITTDDPNYAEEIAKVFDKTTNFKANLPQKIQKNPEFVFPTYFCEKWKRSNRSFYYQEYVYTR